MAQEKTRVWRTARRQDPATGKRYPWLYQEQAMVNHWYFYGFDADFGPFFIKFCGYFPYTGQIYFNGHEYAKRQCLKEGIAFTSLDNAFGAVSDAAAVQRICDGLDDQKIYRFAGSRFHVYAADWSAGEVSVSVDGRVAGRLARGDLDGPAAWPFDQRPMYLLLNLAVGGQWPGDPSPGTPFPASMPVDYVKWSR